MKVILNEEQIKNYIKYTIIENLNNEGGEFKNNGNGTLNFSFNSNSDDKSNSEWIDTRVFGTPEHILNGDGTNNGHHKNLANKVADSSDRLELFMAVRNYVKNGFTGKIDYNGDREELKEFLDKVNKKYKIFQGRNNDDPLKETLNWIDQNIQKLSLQLNFSQNMYSKASGRVKRNNNSKIGRYQIGKVPGTNIDVIALFEMRDFNVSDAIKNGNARQNDLTDKLLGIDKQDRETVKSVGRGKNPYKKLDVTYDNGLTPDIAGNFSLDNVKQDHFKSQYQYQGGKYNTSEMGYDDLNRELSKKKNYTSVNQFLDKSILTARYALNELEYKPDFIVSVPSSSKFNNYYCTNLAHKLGIPYINDFFKRNVINITYDEQTKLKLDRAGADEKDHMLIKKSILNAVYGEIGSMIKQKVMEYLNSKQDLFSNINSGFHSRSGEKIDLNYLSGILSEDICKQIVSADNIDESVFFKNAIKNSIKTYNGLKIRNYTPERERIKKEISKRINSKIEKQDMEYLYQEIYSILKQYSDKIDKGFSVNVKKFKIVDIEMRFRNCLNNVYIISDKVMNKQNNELQTRYKNAKFLIFDEDMNSGASLRCVCDVMQDNLDNSDENIMCLVNGFSTKGR